MWIIVFTLAVFVALLGLLRFTRLGLEMRAVTQNRAMAASMGIRTARIDALTFGLGSGIAGIAGVALSQIDNVSPNLGQGYIIDSFLVVVFGGVGNLWGTLVGAFTLGIANKFLEPYRRRGARQDRDPGADHPVHPEAPARAVRPQGPGGGGMTASPLIRALDRGAVWFVLVLAAIGVIVPLLESAAAAELALARADLSGGAVGQVCLLRAARALDRPDLGLLRHPLARPRRVLRARRLRDGHVPDAPDRHARRLRASDPARTSWCS